MRGVSIWIVTEVNRDPVYGVDHASIWEWADLVYSNVSNKPISFSWFEAGEDSFSPLSLYVATVHDYLLNQNNSV